MLWYSLKIVFLARMIWNANLKIVCVSLWTLAGMVCALVTQYELYTDKFCSDCVIEFELLASSLLSCLAYTPSVGALIYHRESNTCYGIKEGYPLDGFMTTLVGAKLYVKVIEETQACPRGVFIHESCYFVSGNKETWSYNMHFCKMSSTTAHLADIKTDEENRKVLHWLLNSAVLEDFDDVLMFWLGGKYDNGWVWSDGTPVDLEYWPQGRHLDFGGMCMVLILDRVKSETKWYGMYCELDAVVIGLCEIYP